MKNKISTLLCLTMLFGLCGCSTAIPTPVSDSSISEVPSSSSSEVLEESITLSTHEATVIAGKSIEISFRTSNYRGEVLVANSNPEICSASIKSKKLVIKSHQAGVATLTVIAGNARDELTLTVEAKTIAFLERSADVHVNNVVNLMFTTNADSEDLNFEILNLDDESAISSPHLLRTDHAVRLWMVKPCDFQVKVMAGDVYDIMDVHGYLTPWPAIDSKYLGRPLTIRNLGNEIGDICSVIKLLPDECRLDYRFECGFSITMGITVQYGEKDGKYFFQNPVFDLDNPPEGLDFFVVDFETMSIWVEFQNGYDGIHLHGPNFEPYHLDTFAETYSIYFADLTVRVGEEVTFVSSATNEGAEYYSAYSIHSKEFGVEPNYTSLDPFNRTVIFNEPGEYRVFAEDKLTLTNKEVTVTVVAE